MSPTTSNAVFLAACIKYAKEKIVVDFEALSKELGMSKGGAANKFRIIIKQLEEDGAAWISKVDKEPNAPPATSTKRKAPAKKDSDKAQISVKDEGGSTSEDNDIEPLKKKARSSFIKKDPPKHTEDAENDRAATPVPKKKSKDKGVKKAGSATDEGILGDDEATPGKDVSIAPKAAIKNISTAKMVDAAVAICKTDTTSSEGDD
ncbi:hypothetical protein AYL99_03348 [Fonsecaea erecta]|uniref:Myb-like DNA-binding domain-containing protein n=1 Tax=Fonsecaea erecta TaxID=1367422 RepID=A0A178ZMX5_9EURO|nr:hypothetical protein AYL99_03348 [Fonsecaea erecta]OAP61147.1 hypothetical protein AYL99_03348 [Fonsecaea erecta]